jgi:hypothetical protein
MRLLGNEHALAESGLLADGVLERILPCKTDAGASTGRAWLAGCTTSASLLKSRAAVLRRIQADPTHTETLAPILEKARAAEEVLKELQAEEESALSSEADAQIYFKGEYTRPINEIPYVIAIFTAFKIYMAPFLALCMPLILCVMPYVLLTGLMNVPIPWETYKLILFQYILGINPQEPWSLKQIMKLVWTLASFGQGIIQPILTAFSTARLRNTYHRYADAIRSYAESVRLCAVFYKRHGLREPKLPPLPADSYVLVEWWRREKTVGIHYRELLGYYDLLYTLGSDRRWVPVQFGKNEKMNVRGFYDVALDDARAKSSNIVLGGHNLITGPNRGGKSSALRGMLQAVLCTQSFGACWRAQVFLGRPYRRIYTRLVATDMPGAKSLFESDVAFALEVLKGAQSQAGNSVLVMIDELFHSTNPRDAELSAAYFLRQLWRTGAHSMISTHMFQLLPAAEAAGVRLQCVPAWMIPDDGTPHNNGQLKYSYSVSPGVCTVSSVAEVWTSLSASPSGVSLSASPKTAS